MLQLSIHPMGDHYVCVFIKLHITAQPGPVNLISQCYRNGSTLWGVCGLADRDCRRGTGRRVFELRERKFKNTEVRVKRARSQAAAENPKVVRVGRRIEPRI